MISPTISSVFEHRVAVNRSNGYDWPRLSRVSLRESFMEQTKDEGQSGPPPPAPVKIYPSKAKLGILIIPCLFGVGMALQTDGASEFVLAEMSWTNIAAVIICLFVAVLVIQMAFDRKPVLIFDADGIFCQRPPLGQMPWSAVIGMGAGNATLVRRVLMIAVDPSQLNEKARNYMSNSVGMLTMVSPQLRKFKSQSDGYPSVHIPISQLSMPMRKIESLAQEFVLYYVAKEE